MRPLLFLSVLLLITTLTYGQSRIYYNDNCEITMKDLGTHYRVATVDTVLKIFLGEANEFWTNDSLKLELSYDLNGNRDGFIEVKSQHGDSIISGEYSKGIKSGDWRINTQKPVMINFTNKKNKRNQSIDTLEACLVKKENFNVSKFIRKSEYPHIYSLISGSRSGFGRVYVGTVTIVEERPYFPNGMQVLGQFISAYMNYPEEAIKNNIKGQVLVEFTITEDGSTTDFTIIKSLGHGCDEEAIRVLKLLPDWIPGYQRGKAVRTKIKLPITFG